MEVNLDALAAFSPAVDFVALARRHFKDADFVVIRLDSFYHFLFAEPFGLRFIRAFWTSKSWTGDQQTGGDDQYTHTLYSVNYNERLHLIGASYWLTEH